MAMLDIDSDTSTVVPFGNTLVQVNRGVGSPVAVQLRTAGAGERTSTSMGSPSRMTETMDKKFTLYNYYCYSVCKSHWTILKTLPSLDVYSASL